MGSLHGTAAASRHARDCRWTFADARSPEPVRVTGRVTRIEGDGMLRVHLDRGGAGGPASAGCSAEVRVRWPVRGPGEPAASGMRVALEGTWRAGERFAPGLDPVFAGTLVATDARVLGPAPGVGAALARRRDALARRITELFPREAPLVQALVVARRGELGRATRDAFVATGTVHLLAISGFHVGLLAALAVGLLQRVVPPARAAAGGAVLALGYVALLGVPDAALRAGVLLALVSLGRMLSRPVLASGALGSALLVLVAVDPAMAGRVGAQLSFAGAFGLALGARPLTRRMHRAVGRPPAHARTRPPGGVHAVLDGALAATAAAIVATVATLPLVAWHFERVSLVSVPATLIATPFVALALPAIVAALALDLVIPAGLAAAGWSPVPLLTAGAEGLLGALRVVVTAAAGLPWASVPVARGTVVLALAGTLGGLVLARGLPRVGLATRAAAALAALTAALLLAPWAQGWARQGRMELHVLDVGQGDALALRTPAGRWVLIDAGPPPGARLTRALTRLGVRRVELLILTHPDADHVGGLAPVLEAFDVQAVAGPGTVRAAGPWRDALAVARARGVAWRTLERGMELGFDGVVVRVLHPLAAAANDPARAEPVSADLINARSVVLHVEWRGVDAILTGDAPESVERLFAPSLGAALAPVEVLKVGHHGSRTSTGPELLTHLRPQVALIPVGRGNRYGHPHPTVLARLDAAGVRVWRTDRDGPLALIVNGAGEWSVGPTAAH